MSSDYEVDTVTICSQQGVDFWGLERGDDQCLPIELAPLIECPQSHTREVHIVGLPGPQVKVTEHMLGGGEGEGGWQRVACQNTLCTGGTDVGTGSYSEVLPVLHEKYIRLVQHKQFQRGQEVKISLLPARHGIRHSLDITILY